MATAQGKPSVKSAKPPARGGMGVAGVAGHNVPFGWVQVTGKAGQSIVLSAVELPVRYGAQNLGTFLQADRGSVDVEFTLAHPEFALTDELQAGLPWGNKTAVAPTNIVPVSLAYTAMRITFNSDATLYVGVS